VSHLKVVKKWTAARHSAGARATGKLAVHLENKKMDNHGQVCPFFPKPSAGCKRFVGNVVVLSSEISLAPQMPGEILIYNLSKFSKVLSDFETIHFDTDAAQKYDIVANFLEYKAPNAYPEGI
jgi:hypothetical protein